MNPVLNYERRGTGETLLLIHGIGSRWQIWEPVLDTLAEHFDVIAIDLPGFGASPATAGEVNVYRLTDAVQKFCADLGIERPHVAGNSMGGGIALELGKRGSARSVTAFSPIGFWRTPGRVWTQSVLRAARALLRPLRPALPWILRSSASRIALLGLVFGKPSRLDPDTALADIDGLLGAPSFDQALAAFAGYFLDGRGELTDIPITIAWGNRDTVLTYATQSRRARAQVPYARHVTLNGCGHTPFADDPRACAEVLLSHLESR